MTIVWPGNGTQGDGVGALKPGQPVVALDFDGVLNVSVIGGREAQPPPGFERRMIELDRNNWPDHPYIRPLPFGDFPVRHPIVTSAEHIPMVQEWLAAGAAVIWATTWELAIREPARLCGLPDLPVLRMSAVQLAELPDRTALWKLGALEATFPGHPLVWVDDFGTPWEGESQFGDPATPFLSVAPNEYVGLTAEQASRVTDFVRRYA
jgi:hypothetical protein